MILLAPAGRMEAPPSEGISAALPTSALPSGSGGATGATDLFDQSSIGCCSAISPQPARMPMASTADPTDKALRSNPGIIKQVLRQSHLRTWPRSIVRFKVTGLI